MAASSEEWPSSSEEDSNDSDGGATVDEDSEHGERPGGYMVLSPGDVLDDRFDIESKLGCGHFSNVFKATDRMRQGETVAVKLYKSRYAYMAEEEAQLLRRVVGAQYVATFMDQGAVPEREWAVDLCTESSSSSDDEDSSSDEESSSSSDESSRGSHESSQNSVSERSVETRVRSSSSCCSSSVGTAGGPRRHVWLSMELMGPSLKSILREHPEGLPTGTVRTITTHLLRGLAELHAAGVVHTDIKPENVLCPVGLDGAFKLCDVGSGLLLSDLDQEDDSPRQTHDYRAPEVMVGYHMGNAMDVWSLGCCVFEAATGERLFDIAEEDTELGRDFELLGLIMELLGPLPTRMVQQGKWARRLVSRNGTVKHPRCQGVERWPIQDVLTDKYDMDKSDAEALADFLRPMLTLNPNARVTPEAHLQHVWLRQSS